jgi:hypothetical protein
LEVTDMFKCSYNSLDYYGEYVYTSVKRVAQSGYDTLELMREADLQKGGATGNTFHINEE